jgi:hypothetical protein
MGDQARALFTSDDLILQDSQLVVPGLVAAIHSGGDTFLSASHSGAAVIIADLDEKCATSLCTRFKPESRLIIREKKAIDESCGYNTE